MYRYVLDASAAESAFLLATRQRDELVKIFRVLAENPFQESEEYFAGSNWAANLQEAIWSMVSRLLGRPRGF